MKENKESFGTDFAKIDAHVTQPHEYDELPELTDEWFEAADFFIGGQLVQRGRPRVAHPKKAVALRLDTEIVEAFRAQGKGWQTRINGILKEWLTAHPQA